MKTELRQVKFTLPYAYTDDSGAKWNTTVTYVGFFHEWGLAVYGTNQAEDDTNFSVAIIEVFHPLAECLDNVRVADRQRKQTLSPGQIVEISPEKITFIQKPTP